MLNAINTEAGRFLLNLKHDFPVVKATPNSVHQWTGEEVLATFWIDDFVYRKIGSVLDKIEIASELPSYESFLHFSDLERKAYKYPTVYLVTETFNNNTGDGYLLKADVVFATARNAAAADSAVATTLHIRAHTSYQIRRSFFPINTSSISDKATVSSSSLTIQRNDSVTALRDNDDGIAVLIPQDQDSDTTLATGDYDSVTFTSKANQIDFGATSDGGDLVFTLTDQSLISLTGHTELCVTTKNDLDNDAPTGENSMGFTPRTDGSNPPVLSVTYTAPSESYSFFM